MVPRLFFLALAYFAAGWLGLKIPSVGSHVTLVWLPTGIAVAALLRWGWAVWPGVYLGAFLVNLSVGSSWPLAAGIAVGNTLGPLLTIGWLRRVEFHPAFDRQSDVGAFIAAAAVGMTVSASGGVFESPPRGTLEAGFHVGCLAYLVAGRHGRGVTGRPVLLTLTRKSIEQLSRERRALLHWIAVAAPVTWLTFFHDYGQTGRSLPLAFLTLPLPVWAALRFGNTGAALAGLVFSVIAAWSTATGNGSFHTADVHISLFLLWSYMATTVLMGLLIIALQTERLHAEDILRESEEKLRGLYELSPLGIVLNDMNGRFVEFNEAFRRICGYPAEQLKALDYWTLTPKKYEADEARQLESLERIGCYGPFEKEYIRQDGSLVPLQLNGMLITAKEGQKYIWSIVEDITDRRRMDTDLRIAATAFEAQVGIIVTDVNGVILRVNRAFTEDTGYAAEEVIGQTPNLFKSGRHDAAFYAAMWESLRTVGVWQGEIWDRRKNGEIYPKWLTITAVSDDDGVTTNYVSTQIDITERKLAEEQIRNLAFYDPLTRLPNRRLLLDRLHQALATNARIDRHGAFLFIDLDNFKTLNDTLGHHTGDLLLQQVAQRLSDCVREVDTVARFGGDEFVVMLVDLSHDIDEAAAQTEMVGEKILATFKQPYTLGIHEHHSTASIGITLFGSQHETTEELLTQADLAMYQAKAAGRNAMRFFDPQMQAAVTARVGLERELRDAVQQGQFILYYQAQVDGEGRLTGAEVLLRWQHPQRGLMLPHDFISLAEATGLILPLGQWVLESACVQLVAWSDRSDAAHLTLAVNVSAQQLRQSDFVEQVQTVLDRTGADPRKLKLELTESLLLADAEDTIAKMTTLKAKGIDFLMDDFGTGYSSLSYLKRLPLEKLKIDRSFVMDVLTDPNDAAIARTIVALAQSLSLGVIAEGVETDEQRDFLAGIGCYAYQGYLFSRPLPLEEFELLVARD